MDDTVLQTVLADLDEVIKELGGVPETGKVKFWTDLAHRLSRAIGLEKDWDWRYPAQVHNRQTKPSQDFAAAVKALGIMLDGAPPVIANTVPVSILAQPGAVRPGSLVLGESRPCANPGCRVWFVPRSWNGTTCSPECKKAVRRLRDQNRRKAKHDSK